MSNIPEILHLIETDMTLLAREIATLTEERDRLRGSLAAYEAELARVERELSAKNI